MAVELPPGTHNARPFRDGVLFNDTEANALRYAGRGDGQEDRAMRVPTYDPEESLLHATWTQSGLARQGFARGLCVLSDALVAGGSSPSTITVYDLPANEPRAVGQPDAWTCGTPSTASRSGPTTRARRSGRFPAARR